MWTRAELKQRAKENLKSVYWSAFGVSLVIMLAGGSHTGLNGSSGSSNNQNSHGWDWMQGNPEMKMVFISVIAFFVLVVILYRIFAGFALEVGGRNYFKTLASQGDLSSNSLTSMFREGRYFPVIRGMLRRSVMTFLWFLLLIIPGIIMGYAYRMTPYILSDNPQIGAKKAMDLSREMTRGEKWNIFVLDLSFLGWYILGLLALVVGVLFVKPYDNSTNGELYIHLRNKALEQGLCSSEELNIQDK